MQEIINKLKSKIIEELELPATTIVGVAKITIISNMAVEIENSYGIIEYMKEKIKIDMRTNIITIFGSNLSITNIGDDTISINGIIEKVFLKEEQ